MAQAEGPLSSETEKEEESNFLKAFLLQIGVGAQSLRELLLKDMTIAQLADKAKENQALLTNLLRKGHLGEDQYRSLITEPDPSKWDISTMITLLQIKEIYPDIPPPTNSWRAKYPSSRDETIGDQLLRFRNMRNRLAHAPTMRMSAVEFDEIWKELTCIILRIMLFVSPDATVKAVDMLSNLKARTFNTDGAEEKTLMQTFLETKEQIFTVWFEKFDRVEKSLDALTKQNADLKKKVITAGEGIKFDLNKLQENFSQLAEEVSFTPKPDQAGTETRIKLMRDEMQAMGSYLKELKSKSSLIQDNRSFDFKGAKIDNIFFGNVYPTGETIAAKSINDGTVIGKEDPKRK